MYGDANSDQFSGPGDVLPTMSVSDANQSLITTLQVFQEKISNNFSTLGSKVDSVKERMDSLETRQKALEDGLSSSSSSVSNSPSISGSGKNGTGSPLLCCK